MNNEISLNIQRWIFERGNYQIIVDNAWNIDLNSWKFGAFSQERITVNGEIIHNRPEVRKPVLFWRTMFEDTILDSSGELELKVQWRSVLMTVKARLLIDDDKHDWSDVVEKKWIGMKGEWPDPEYYKI